ncbi:MAG: ComEC/Rec2 family competence protein, partial [Myxococcales bacterium]|nr:ComEC/Rec2 family competence protein [Myxococcales bacterium]
MTAAPSKEMIAAPSKESLDPVLPPSAALVTGSLLIVAPLEVLCAGAAVVGTALAARRISARVALVAAAVLALAAVRSQRAIDRQGVALQRAALALPVSARCAGHARVVSSPVRQREGLRWDAWLEVDECDGARVRWAGQATLHGGPEALARGDEADVVATLAPPQRLWNPSTGDPRPGEARRQILRSGGLLDVHVTRRGAGPAAWIDRIRAHLRRRIEASFAPDVEPMVRALVLGESDLDRADDQAFRASGLSHLLAVSGMHLVLVLAASMRILEALLCRVESLAARIDPGRLAAATGIPIAWTYAGVAGEGGSTVRAAWMMSVALAARASGRRTDAVRAFALSLAAMAIVDPLVAFDLSFALSVAATGGLLAFSAPLAAGLTPRLPRRLSPLAAAAATTLAASIPCTPILARFGPTLPVGAVLANLLAVPLGEGAALPLCFAHALLGWWPSAERGAAAAATGSLLLVRAVARAFSRPALVVGVPRPTSWELALLAILAPLLLLRRSAWRTWCGGGLAGLLFLECVARRAGAPRRLLRATFLDVGQGDAAIIDLPDGEAVLVDGGGLVGSPIDVGERVVAPELRARRRSRLAAVVLTHPHPDHFGGLASGLEDVRVGAVWDTGQGEAEAVGGGYQAFLTQMRERRVPILRPRELCGTRVIGGAIFEVLAPCPSFLPDVGPNDNSFVIRIRYG